MFQKNMANGFCGINVNLVVVIANHGMGEKLAGVFSQIGAPFNIFCMGRGTANKKVLSYLGLGETEKEILFTVVSEYISERLLLELNKETKLSKPGQGIAFSIPINGIADSGSCRRTDENCDGGKNMDKQTVFDLIIAFTNQGYADEVMDVAKSAGASGGTIIHARAAGMKEAEKFFGISIQPEKEMLIILTHTEKSQAIMKAIVEKGTLQTDARTIALSVPVNGVAGLTPAPLDSEEV